MSTRFDPAALVRTARTHAGLSQRAMAERAGTAQSVVARIETGATDPSGDTLARLLAAAAFELRCELTPVSTMESHMLTDVERTSDRPQDRQDVAVIREMLRRKKAP